MIDIFQCPICSSSPLVQNMDHTIYECDKVIVNPKSRLSHYTLFIKNSVRRNTHQMIVLPPFLFDTKEIDDKTRVYWYGKGGTNFIMSISRIDNWSEPQRIADRIKNLVVFA